MANLINLVDPALVLIGGEGLRAGALIEAPMRAAMPLHIFGRPGDAFVAERVLTLRATSDLAWARGAASLVLREVFRPPIYETGEDLVIDTLLASEPSRRRRRG